MTRTTRPLAAAALAIAAAVWLVGTGIGTLRATVSRVDPDTLVTLLAPLLTGLVASVLLYAALVLAVHHAVPAARELATGVLALNVVSLLPSLGGLVALVTLPILVIQLAALIALWVPFGTRGAGRPVVG